MMTETEIRRILNNPQATAAEIRRLFDQDPALALQHPNCPPEIWWDSARSCPMEALASPAYELMLLDNPQQWQTIVENNCAAWIGSAIPEEVMPDASWWLLAADCLDHALAQRASDTGRATDQATQDAVQVRRRIASGELSAREAGYVITLLIGEGPITFRDSDDNWQGGWIDRALRQVPWFTTIRMVANQYPIWCWNRFLTYWRASQAPQVGAIPRKSSNPYVREALAQGPGFTAERIKEILGQNDDEYQPEALMEFAAMLPSLPLFSLITIEDPSVLSLVNTFIPGTAEADESMQLILSDIFDVQVEYGFSYIAELGFLYDLAGTILLTADYIKGGWASSALVQMAQEAYDELQVLIELAMKERPVKERFRLPAGGLAGIAKSLRRKKDGLWQFMPKGYSFAACFVSAAYSAVDVRTQ